VEWASHRVLKQRCTQELAEVAVTQVVLHSEAVAQEVVPVVVAWVSEALEQRAAVVAEVLDVARGKIAVAGMGVVVTVLL
jgi:hypothetical protein